MAAALALPLVLAGIIIVIKWTKKDGSSTEVKVAVGEDAPKRLAPPPAVRATGKVAAYPHGSGRWLVEGDELVQANPDADATGLYFGEDAWEDYDFTVKFKRLKGAPRLAIRFRCQDAMNDCTFGLHMDRQLAWLSQHFARKSQQLGLDAPSEVGDGWHKLTAKLRGQKVECLINDRIIYQLDSIVYRRGYVGIALNTETSVRFKDLQVTDKDGRVLIGGVTDLDLADRPGSPAAKFDDEAKAGTVWKGNVVQYINDKPVFKAEDYELRILTRDGMNFTAECWIEGKTRGMKIEGRIDAKGNVSYVPVNHLGVGRPMVLDDQLGKWQLATFKGKNFFCVAINSKDPNNRAVAALTRTD